MIRIIILALLITMSDAVHAGCINNLKIIQSVAYSFSQTDLWSQSGKTVNSGNFTAEYDSTCGLVNYSPLSEAGFSLSALNVSSFLVSADGHEGPYVAGVPGQSQHILQRIRFSSAAAANAVEGQSYPVAIQLSSVDDPNLGRASYNHRIDNSPPPPVDLSKAEICYWSKTYMSLRIPIPADSQAPTNVMAKDVLNVSKFYSQTLMFGSQYAEFYFDNSVNAYDPSYPKQFPVTLVLQTVDSAGNASALSQPLLISPSTANERYNSSRGCSRLSGKK